MSTGLESVRLAWSAVPEGGDRRAVAWGLVRELLGDAGPSARLTNPCAYCGGPHGPLRVGGAPYLAGIAYARDLAVAAVVDAHATRTFAIDAEPDDASGAGLVLGAGAGRTVRDWVRVEAALKADGRGLRVDPALVEVREDADGWTAAIPGRAVPLRGRDLAGPPGVLVSAVTDDPAAAGAPAGRASP